MRQRIQRIVMLVGVLLAAVFGAVSGPAIGGAQASEDRRAAFTEARGFYEVGPGEFLYLGGTASSPAYELDGSSVALRRDPDGRYLAGDGSGLELQIVRSTDGTVAGLEVARSDQAPVFAPRLDRFREDDVTFDSGGVTIAGTVVLPVGDGPFPAIVMVHGAERANRDTYRAHAHHFAAAGVSALIYDRRGTGESGGSWHGATFDDLADDALAGVMLLRSHESIDSGRVGVWGISQGAWVAPMTAATSDDVAFVVAISASGVTPAKQELWRIGNQLRYRELGDRPIDTALKTWRMLYTIRPLVEAGLPISSSTPGFWFLSMDPDLDPVAIWRDVRQPVLGVWGELDCQLPAQDSLAVISQALAEADNATGYFVILPGADHMLTVVPPCAHELGWHHEPRMQWAPGYRGTMTAWILAQGDESQEDRFLVIASEFVPNWLRVTQGHQLVDVVPAAVSDAASISRLGWVSVAERSVRWHETAVTRLMLLGAAASTLGAGAAGSAFRRLRAPQASRYGWPRATVSRLTVAVLAAGIGALLASLWTLVELMIISDVHVPQSFGTPVAFGLSTAFLASTVLGTAVALASLALGVALVSDRRVGRPLRASSVIALAGGLLVALWCLGWGLLVV